MLTLRIRRWLHPILLTILLTSLLLMPSPLQASGTQFALHTPQSTVQNSSLFVENVGQFPASVLFLVRGGTPGVVWLAQDAIWITLVRSEARGQRSEVEERDGRKAISHPQSKSYNLKLSFPGANPRPRIEPFNRLDTRINYYRGNDPTRWRENVPVWGGVRYADLYPGVDLEISGESGEWEWRLVFRAPYSASDIRLSVQGAEAVELQQDSVRIRTTLGDLALPLLAVGGQARLSAAPRILSPALRDLPPASFEIAAPFAQSTIRTLPSTIHDQQSALLYSTFLGGSASDEANAVAVDGGGAAYVTGWTFSTNFTTTPGLDSTLGGNADVFVAKLNASGTALIYATYLGGSLQASEGFISESGNDIAVDGNGAAYLTGYTWSSDFPVTSGAFDTTHNREASCNGSENCYSDAFVVKLNSAGALVYGTYLGGSYLPYGVRGGSDEGKAIAVNAQGVVYVAGWTESWDFPTTPGAFKTVFSNEDYGLNMDVFVTKLNPAGNGTADLLYSTYVGGAWTETANDLALDANGYVYVTGSYEHGPIFDFPTTPGAFDPGPPNAGDIDAFVFKLSPAGGGASDLVYSTLLGPDRVAGESGRDTGYSVAVDNGGYVYIAGTTDAKAFPTTPGAFDRTCGTDGNCDFIQGFGSPGDIFVGKLRLAGQGAADLVYSTFLGGSYLEEDPALVVDAQGDIYVTGGVWRPATGFPTTPGAFDTTFNGSRYYDAFVTRVRPQGQGANDLIYSTFLGGAGGVNPEDGQDRGTGIALGGAETVYIVGNTNSADWPTTPNAFDTTYGGGLLANQYAADDGFVARLRVEPSYLITGRAVDSQGQPVIGAVIAAGETYSATTNVSGYYTLTMPTGVYTLTPTMTGYLWSPASRSVAVPPHATDQNFVRLNLIKEAVPAGMASLARYSDTITYTLRFVYPLIAGISLYDATPTYTTYISGSLVSSKPGVVYDPATNVITGPLILSGGEYATVTFAAMVNITGSAEFGPIIQNQARVCPLPGYGDVCEWSNTTLNYTYLWTVYLPIVARN